MRLAPPGDPGADAPARQLGVDPETRPLVRCIPVSTAVDIVHIALGAAGILMAASLAGSVRYAQGLCAVCFLMVLIGLLPGGAHSLWDVAPLTGGEMAFNLIFVTMAFYFGWVHTHRYIPAAQQTQAGPR